MRASFAFMALCLSAAALLLAGSLSGAGEKKTDTTLKVKGKLTKDDNEKIHVFKMTAGKTYVIDMKTLEKTLDPLLRLEDPDGKTVAEDDDGGGIPNARIYFKAGAGGDYKIIATSFMNTVGKYSLVVREAGPADLIVYKALTLPKAKPEEREHIVAEFAKHLEANQKTLGLHDVQIAFQVGQFVEETATELAPKTYADFGKLFGGADDPKVADFGRMFTGASRRLKLPGNAMAIKAKTVQGKEVNWKSYRGKVVLVDFWASWCGPCVAELPNVKKMYDAYKERGFDVLSISLDTSEAAMRKFMEEKKLPWLSIYDKTPGNEISKEYGVFVIPLAILVDKEGKVLSMRARGPELRRLLEQHLGSIEKSGKKPKDDSSAK